MGQSVAFSRRSDDGDDVEAVFIGYREALEERVGGADDASDFLVVDRVEGVVEVCRARFYFDEDHAVAFDGNDVDFAGSNSRVSLHYFIAFCDQVVAGDLLAPCSEVVVCSQGVFSFGIIGIESSKYSEKIVFTERSAGKRLQMAVGLLSFIGNSS